MKYILFFFAALILSMTVKGQCDTLSGVNIYAYDKPFDSIDACYKDTVQIYMVYVDTTMTQGMRTIKVNGVYTNFRYRFPVRPEVKFKIGYGIKLKNEAGEVSIVNPNQSNLFHGFSYGKYLDEIKVPLQPKYLVILAIGLNYEYQYGSP